MSVGCAEQSNCTPVIVMNTRPFCSGKENILQYLTVSLTVSLDQFMFACGCGTFQKLLTLGQVFSKVCGSTCGWWC